MLIQNIAKDAFKLLKKDLILLKWRLILICLVIIPFVVIGTFLGHPAFDRSSFVAIFLMNLLFIFAILSVEIKVKNQNLLPILPLTRKSIVLSRYLGIFVFYLATLIFYLFLSLIINLSHLPLKLSWIMFDTILSSGLSVVFLASISIFLQFALRNISTIFIAIYFFPYTIIYMSRNQFFSVLIWIFTKQESFDGSYNIYIILFLFLLLLVSCTLSLWVYKKREFV